MLSACSLRTGVVGGAPSGPRPSSAPTTAASSTAEATATSADAARPGYVDCSDREEYMRVHRESCDPREPIIVGLSVDDAKRKLAAIGFTGPVKVSENHEFDPSCKADHVCGFQPRRWYVEGQLTLHINRKLSIGVPD
jgi:hypothetical protein